MSWVCSLSIDVTVGFVGDFHSIKFLVMRLVVG